MIRKLLFDSVKTVSKCCIVQGRSWLKHDATERKFRFPFYSSVERWVQRACAVSYRTGYRPRRETRWRGILSNETNQIERRKTVPHSCPSLGKCLLEHYGFLQGFGYNNSKPRAASGPGYERVRRKIWPSFTGRRKNETLNRAATPGNAPGRADNHGAWIPVKHTKLKPARLKIAERHLDVTTPLAGCHAGVTARGLWLVASEPRDTMKTPNLSEVEQTIPRVQQTCSVGLLCSTDLHRAEQSIP